MVLLFAPAAAAISPRSAIARTLEPVIIKGKDLPKFLGTPVTQIFVYAYHAGNWTQLPAQVDEIDASGNYVVSENGLLDANDEIAFMARDLGDPSGGAAPVSSIGTIVMSWYELTVTDPIHPGDHGWAYVVRSASFPPILTNDYVTFNGSNHRIIGNNYTLGFASPRPWLDYLALGGSGIDILDRAPKYRYCRGALCLNENLSPDTSDGLVKDGPVRAILRDGRVVAYGWMALSIIPLTIPPSLAPDFVRFSTDFNASAAGATFYNGAAPGGVSVDGSPDVVPETPFSSWSQLSHSTGTIVQVFDVTEMGGTATNYYVDDSQTDNQDTGDKQHYGDAGTRVTQPNLSFTYRTTLYFLDGAQPNLGETYVGYVAQPLQSAVQWQELAFTTRLYLPMVLH
jgi:hypothetical protein